MLTHTITKTPVKKRGKHDHILHGLNFIYVFNAGSEQTRDEPATPDELVVYNVYTDSGDDLTEAYDNGLFNNDAVLKALLEAHYENN